MLWWTRASKFRLPESTLRGNQIVLSDDLFDGRIEWTGISDAGRAAVTDEIKAELIQVGLQSGLFQILSHDSRTGCQRVLNRRTNGQPMLDRLLGQQPGASMTLGFEVLVQEVIAAIKTSPCPRSISACREFFRMNFLEPIGRWTIVDHFRLGPDTGVDSGKIASDRTGDGVEPLASPPPAIAAWASPGTPILVK